VKLSTGSTQLHYDHVSVIHCSAEEILVVMTATGADDWEDDDVTDCPECGAEIYVIAERCPKCGYWFVEQDRRAMRANRRNESSIAEASRELRIVKIGAMVLLALAALFLVIAGAMSLLSGG
jgi:hypothetical protein